MHVRHRLLGAPSPSRGHGACWRAGRGSLGLAAPPEPLLSNRRRPAQTVPATAREGAAIGCRIRARPEAGPMPPAGCGLRIKQRYFRRCRAPQGPEGASMQLPIGRRELRVLAGCGKSNLLRAPRRGCQIARVENPSDLKDLDGAVPERSWLKNPRTGFFSILLEAVAGTGGLPERRVRLLSSPRPAAGRGPRIPQHCVPLCRAQQGPQGASNPRLLTGRSPCPATSCA